MKPNLIPTQSLDLTVGSLSVNPTYTQAAVIVVLIFLLLLLFARITRTYVSWYMSGWFIWAGIGFVLAVIVEGFFLVSGSTVLTRVLGWKDATKPIRVALDAGRAKLINVLGAQDEAPTPEGMLEDFAGLEPDASAAVKAAICEE